MSKIIINNKTNGRLGDIGCMRRAESVISKNGGFDFILVEPTVLPDGSILTEVVSRLTDCREFVVSFE